MTVVMGVASYPSRWRGNPQPGPTNPGPSPGNPTPFPVPRALPARFARRIRRNADTGCWEWTGGRFDNGYGAAWYGGRTGRAHRAIYEMLVGPIPDGLQLDHLCRVRHCVNPAHLEPVTAQVNTLRSPDAPAAENARKTHCVNGHEFTPENTRIAAPRGREVRGWRQCRACNRERMRPRMRARRATKSVPRNTQDSSASMPAVNGRGA